MERKCRNSARALIIKEGKMAVVKIRDADKEWYALPGGGQEVEETLDETVRREVLEELGIVVECNDLLFVIEGVHSENFHRIDFVFFCKFIDIVPDAFLQSDTNQTGVEWLDISSLELKPLYPSKLRRQIMNFYEKKPYQIYLGNEEIGAPGCMD